MAGPAGGQQSFDELRAGRRERVEGGRTFIEERDRVIIRDGGRTFIRHDEVGRWNRLGLASRFEARGGENYTIVRRGDYEIITVVGPDGRLIRRVRRDPFGREVVLIDNRRPLGPAGFFLNLGSPVVRIPRDRYIVDASAAPPSLLYETLAAPPLEPIDRAYSFDEVRYNAPLRERVRSVDVDSITFATASWEVMPDQIARLEVIANAIKQVIAQSPNAVFLIEGHTDAVGSDVDNLSLSDRRAESVAVVLTNVFQIPPENLTTQGYGEQYLKEQTQGPSRINRRVTVRNITDLLNGGRG